jgi:hypothetical protein
MDVCIDFLRTTKNIPDQENVFFICELIYLKELENYKNPI